MTTNFELETLTARFKKNERRKVIELYQYLSEVNQMQAISVLKQLVEISDDYKQAMVIVLDPKTGRLEKTKFADTKKSVTKLRNGIAKLITILEDIPQTDLAGFELEMFANQPAESCSFRAQLKIAYKTAEAIMQTRSHHIKDSTNQYRTVAAYRVAKVIMNSLGKKVAMTLDSTLNKNSKPTSALYCRLLKMTLALANEQNFDVQKVMAAGITLLNDPDLPK